MTTAQKELPSGWKWVKLGDVCTVITGNTPSKSNSSYYGGEWTWVNPSHLDQSQYIYESSEYLTDAGAKQARVVPTGAVLISCIGYIGKAAIAGKSLCTNQQINSLVPTPVIDSEFLYWCMKRGRARLERSASGVTVNLVNKTNFSKFEIPLPPLEEQKRIAGILNQAEEIKKLREEADKKTEELIPAIFHDMFGDPESPKMKWKKNTLKDLGVKIVAGKSYSTDGDVDSSPYQVLKTSAVSWGVFNHNEVKALPLDYVPPKEHIVNEDDILLSRMNTAALVGASVLVSKCYPNIAIPDRLWRVVVPKGEGLVNAYLWGYLNSPLTRAKITSISSGTSGSMKNISQANLLSLSIPIPPLETQMTFASRRDLVLRTSDEQRHSCKRIEELKSALLQKAFRGEL